MTDRTDPRAQIQEVIEQLHVPVPDLSTLLSLLATPLDALSLLPPQFRRHSTRRLPSNDFSVRKHIPQIQRALLIHVYPTWSTILQENKEISLIDQYFCPDSFSNVSASAGEVALLAYSTILSSELSQWAIHYLNRLTLEYPIDRLHTAVFARKDIDKVAKGVSWEDCVRNVCMVPSKAANKLADKQDAFPNLQNSTYFNNLSIRFEQLVQSLSSTSSRDALHSIAYLLTKLVNVGVFPSKPPIARSQPSFFQSILPLIRSRLANGDNSKVYSVYWASIFLNIPSQLILQSILASLFGSLSTISPPLNASPIKRSEVKREAQILSGLVGSVTPDKADLWEITTSLITSRDWDESHARIFVAWLSGAAITGNGEVKALEALLNNVLEVWSSSDHVKHSLLSRHKYTTSLLLLTVSYLPRSSPFVQSLATNPYFVKGISIYISHLDRSVRRCGMLVGEVIATLCNKMLRFEDWKEDDPDTTWYRTLRELINGRDIDATIDEKDEEVETEDITTDAAAETLSSQSRVAPGVPPSKATFVSQEAGYDSDDSMTGYNSPSSSRSPSPTPSELADIEKDPTLNVGRKKIQRPVYLLQVADLLRGTNKAPGPDDPHEADRIEMALNTAEELIRKKKDYGTELDENALNLTLAFLGLQDNFDLPGFDEKRQGALNALVAGAPRKAAPALIEEFFKNQYSVDQRYVAMNALAIGARELASLPIPPSRVSQGKAAFPSKHLPAPLHRKYITASHSNRELVPTIMDQISRQLLNDQKEAIESAHPDIARERKLRIQKPKPSIAEVGEVLNPYSQLDKPIERPKTRFINVAAEYFIMPFMNRFWAFLRDEQTREERTSHLEGRSKYSGAGTGLILNALVLAQFIRTMSILVNDSQNAPEWIAVIAPDALEMAVTLGTRPLSRVDTGGEEDESVEERQDKEASILSSALELALVVLSGSLELDGGRTLGLEHTTLLLGAGEWASKVFSNLERGLKFQGGGGSQEAHLSRAAAGVLLKIDKLTSKWRRSMLDTR